ncbi:hypothetical protein PMI07_006626 [Rhizobium sp. CF080]|uniref:hypothetical protein n=1 Tax=Rhizobium sp. (strain CF080) TaxID=1144310 RepID=UPI0002715E6F|nr:hypothetical protein [Rhizobium sp. CF080]EUB98312.1 hypothetical protein PMI07_006626 [Rhizobium sp. CF080]
MTVSLNGDAIILAGTCGVDEVETLVNYLEARPDVPVDINTATSLHTALWQALMVFKPKMIGAPVSSLMADKLLPVLNAYIDGSRNKLAKASSSK